MAIIPDVTKSNFKIPDAGTYIARCYAMIEHGTQETEFKGVKKLVRQVKIGWELPTEKTVFDDAKGEQPFTVSKVFNLFMSENANLRKTLESWRGKKYTDEEAGSVDITKLLGQPCQITIQHKASKDGQRTYADIVAVTPLMKGINAEPQINPMKVLMFDSFDWNVYNELHEKEREIIAKSAEFKTIQSYNEYQEQLSKDEVEPEVEAEEEIPDLPF